MFKLFILFHFIAAAYCQTFQDNFFCGFIAATNIEYITSGQWSCDADGFTSSNPCDWVYTACNANSGYVVDLTISTYSLKGTLSDSIGDLSSLTALSLSYCNIDGTLPSTINTLSNLTRLDLSVTSLRGAIPDSFGDLIKLKYAYLSYCSFTSLPDTIGNLNSLTMLHLDNNALNGTIPSTLGSMSSLEMISLYGNSIWGNLPTSIGQLSNVLKFVEVSSNSLSSQIPSEVGLLTRLQSLSFDSNHITGTIPSQMGAMMSLTVLELGRNSLVGSVPESIGLISGLQYLSASVNQLTGPVPSTLSTATALRSIQFFSNSLSKSLPSALSQLTALTSFRCYSNQITGSIPPEFGSLSNLMAFDLYDNSISGVLPSSIGSWSQCVTLGLHDNNITGTIPSTIGAMSALSGLVLHVNSFSGSIPSTIGSLEMLSVLDLHQNQLNGTIPSAIGMLTKLQSLSLYHNKLSGTIPTQLGNNTYMYTLYLQYNQLSSDIPSELSSLTNMFTFYANDNKLGGTIPSSLCAWDASYINLANNPDIYCYPACWSSLNMYSQNFKIDDTAQEGCGTCSAGYYFIPSTWQCVICPVGSYTSSNTNISVNNITECNNCPPFTTTLGEGQDRCALFQLEDDLDVVYLVCGIVLIIYLICWVAAGNESVAVLFNMAIPMLDHVTDIYYVMNEGFYSPIIFACAAFFLIAPCIILGQELIEDDVQPVWLYVPFRVLWLGHDHAIPTYCNARIIFPHRYVTTFTQRVALLIIWPICAICQLLTVLLTPLWLCVYWLSMLLWFVIGAFLHNSRTMAVGKVRRMWYKGWSQTDRFGDDIATVDVDVLNRLLFNGFVLETAPQVVIQMVNSILVGWGFIAKLSIAMSIIQVCFGIYKFIYWKWFRGIEFKDIPVLSAMLPSFLQLPVHTTARMLGPSEVGCEALLDDDPDDTGGVDECSMNKSTITNRSSIQESVISSVHVVSKYEAPSTILEHVVWLKSNEGIPTYRGVTLLAVPLQHDNPLKFIYLLVLWLACIFWQLFSIVTLPLWIGVYQYSNVSFIPVTEFDSDPDRRSYSKVVYLLCASFCIIYICFYPDCLNYFGSNGQDDDWWRLDDVICGSGRYFELLFAISFLSAVMCLLILSRICVDTYNKCIATWFVTCGYVLVYLYTLTGVFAEHSKIHHLYTQDVLLGIWILVMFFLSCYDLIKLGCVRNLLADEGEEDLDFDVNVEESSVDKPLL